MNQIERLLSGLFEDLSSISFRNSMNHAYILTILAIFNWRDEWTKEYQ